MHVLAWAGIGLTPRGGVVPSGRRRTEDAPLWRWGESCRVWQMANPSEGFVRTATSPVCWEQGQSLTAHHTSSASLNKCLDALAEEMVCSRHSGDGNGVLLVKLKQFFHTYYPILTVNCLKQNQKRWWELEGEGVYARKWEGVSVGRNLPWLVLVVKRAQLPVCYISVYGLVNFYFSNKQ